MRPILFRPRLLTSCALLALGLHGMTARSLVAQFDPRRFLPGPTTWEDRDAGGPADAGKKAPDEAPARDNRFSAGDGPAERFGAGATPSGSFSAAAGAAPRRGSPAGARTLDLGPGDGKRVVVIPVEGTIDLGLAPFSRRIVEEAGRAGDVAAIVLDINTFGGRVDAAVQIRDALLSSEVPTVAFVNRRAISAGALISLACDVIAVTGGATMGAATPVAISGGKAQPVEEKVVSYMRKEMRATAEAKGRDGDIAEAMVDAQVEVPGISDKGKLLTLTTREGLEHGVFDLEVERVEALLDATNLTGATVDKARVNWAERVARLLTDPVVSGMLMTFGFLGILIELYTAGFGIAGIVGVVCLCLFFLGHVVADLAGWEELLLFSVGLLLIGLEAFGVGGGLGILAITGAALMQTTVSVTGGRTRGVDEPVFGVGVALAATGGTVLISSAASITPTRGAEVGLALGRDTVESIVADYNEALAAALGLGEH